MGGGNNWSSTSWGSWQTASYTGTVDNTGGGAFSGSGNSVTAGANSSTSRREGNLKLSQPRSGIQENGNSWPSPSNINVPLNQEGRDPEWVYVFESSTTLNASWSDKDSRYEGSVSINSYRYDKNNSTLRENVSWNASINNGWDLDDHGEYFVAYTKNPGSYAVATIVQEVSGKILNISCYS